MDGKRLSLQLLWNEALESVKHDTKLNIIESESSEKLSTELFALLDYKAVLAKNKVLASVSDDLSKNARNSTLRKYFYHQIQELLPDEALKLVVHSRSFETQVALLSKSLYKVKLHQVLISLEELKTQLSDVYSNEDFYKIYKTHYGSLTGNLSHRNFMWKGAGVVISEEAVDEVHADYILVVSRNAHTISLLMLLLKQLARPVIDWISKHEFYGNIAKSILQVKLPVDSNEVLKIELQSAVNAAIDIVTLWELDA